MWEDSCLHCQSVSSEGKKLECGHKLLLSKFSNHWRDEHRSGRPGNNPPYVTNLFLLCRVLKGMAYPKASHHRMTCRRTHSCRTYLWCDMVNNKMKRILLVEPPSPPAPGTSLLQTEANCSRGEWEGGWELRTGTSHELWCHPSWGVCRLQRRWSPVCVCCHQVLMGMTAGMNHPMLISWRCALHPLTFVWIMWFVLADFVHDLEVSL